jgi:tetratricopeptide (TPR) repeat protein
VLSSDQNEWVVGRGSQSDIPVENAKISRSHFKIYRDGRTFKIADLGGSSGTRLNGVSVRDARLNSFDTIKAGPVEFQFLIGEKQIAVGSTSLSKALLNSSDLGVFGHLDAGLKLKGVELENSGASTQEKTVFASPVPYAPVGFEAPKPDAGGFAFTPGANTSFRIPNTQFGASASGTRANASTQLPENGLDKLKIWYGNLNTTQKTIWGSLLVLLLLGLAMKINEESAPVTPPVAENNAINTSTSASSASGKNQGDRTPSSEENAATKGDIDPAYYKLSKEKREQIDAAYAKAERAAQDKNWDDAYTYAKEVMDAVPIYKSAAQILYDAQNAKNSNLLGNISANLNNVADAAKENQEKIELLLEAGTKSLQTQQWQNAEENFLKAMALDPSNARAGEGYAKARAKDMSAVADVPNAPVIIDPDSEAKEQLVGEIQSYNRTLNQAKELIRSGQFNESLAQLRQLDLGVKELSSRIKNDRTPASIKQLGSEKVGRLQLSIRESIDAAKLQLEAQYQTRLADAEAFIANKQFVQAKEIYHKILSAEPQFDRVVQERNKLYARLVSEAREKYQEALIYENVGDVDQALAGFEQSKELLQDVDDSTAADYYRKSQLKIRRLKR